MRYVIVLPCECCIALTTKCSQYVNVHKSDLDEGQIRELEQYEISQGPLSVLQQSVRNHSQVLIGITRSFSHASKHSTATPIWYWKMSRKCGLKWYVRQHVCALSCDD